MKRKLCSLMLIFFALPHCKADERGNKDKINQGQQKQSDRGEKQGGGKAQEGGGQKGGGGRGGLFSLLDVDRDGNLSAKEIDGAVAALLKLDVNKDGILDAQELVVRGGGQGGKGGGQQGAGSSQRRGSGQGNRSVNSNVKSE